MNGDNLSFIEFLGGPHNGLCLIVWDFPPWAKPRGGLQLEIAEPGVAYNFDAATGILSITPVRGEAATYRAHPVRDAVRLMFMWP